MYKPLALIKSLINELSDNLMAEYWNSGSNVRKYLKRTLVRANICVHWNINKLIQKIFLILFKLISVQYQTFY